jgi:hypothetical protein
MLRTDEIRLNVVVGEASGWNRGWPSRVEVGAVGVAPLTRGVFTNGIRWSLAALELGEVAVVGEVVAEDEHAGPLVP